jgi:hypothetical protein
VAPAKSILRVLTVVAILTASSLAASDLDEFKVKRKDVFEFTQRPTVARAADTLKISFAVKDFCDATVAIENEDGSIACHLASGVLGANAPEPFQKNSLNQSVTWDGKNDQGVTVINKAAHTVRVSLGLKPIFEKNLYYSPYKRISQAAPQIQANEEGVLVYEGMGVDSVKLFDHEGKYVRTVYPFPASKLNDVKGLEWRDFPQGFHLPWKQSIYQQTLLTSGDNACWTDEGGRTGRAATGMAVRGNRIVLAYKKLNRFSTDGTSGGMDLAGGKTSVMLDKMNTRFGQINADTGPSSVAISPDMKTVYLAGYSYRHASNFDTQHGVMSVPLEGTEDAKVFAGAFGLVDGSRAKGEGTGPGKFGNATSVDCDAQGRVYVTDFMNERVQIFSPDGKFLKELKTTHPALVRLNRKNGEIYVFTWTIPSWMWGASTPQPGEIAVTRYGAFDDPKQIARYIIPDPTGKPIQYRCDGGLYLNLPHALYFTGEIDSWTDTPTIWFGRDCRNDLELGLAGGNGARSTAWDQCGIKVYKEKDGKLEMIRDFGKETLKEAYFAKPPSNAVQHCYVNPVTGHLFLAEADSAPTCKASTQWLDIDPETGSIQIVKLPFNPVDGAFDLDGNAYLRNTNVIVRYDSKTWREIPWDYGEELDHVGADGGIGGHATAVSSGLVLPSMSPVCYHQGGIYVSPKGYVVASCAYHYTGLSHVPGETTIDVKSLSALGKPYVPNMFPGRAVSSLTPCIHVWDKFGKRVYEDAVPGIDQVDGIAMDRNDALYFMHKPSRVLDGKPYINSMSETMTKVLPKKSKVISTSNAAIPLDAASTPTRKQDGAGVWVENAEWFYGGVGFAGFNAGQAGGGCACWFSRFSLDLFARSFVPEPQQFGVAVLDSSGNLILRIGRYSNVDSAGPKSAQPLGGDEVGLFHPLYVGTHSDHRLFIADYGNGRLLSVKLNYNVDEKVPVPEAGK